MKGQYLTENKASYQNFDTSAHTNHLNHERKADLWKSHFNIGNPEAGSFWSTMQASYLNPSGG